MAEKKPNTIQIAIDLITPVLQEHGLVLWDARFEKEGSQWYLRYFIDREDSAVTIQDCETVSRIIDKLLDAADPIDQSYILEVGSPGIEREFTRDEHFEQYMGSDVMVRFIRPVDGERDFVGTLLRKEGKDITIALNEETELSFTMAETAYVRLYADYNDGGKQG